MGAYDDLVPSGGASASGGTYADLVPKGATVKQSLTPHADPLRGVRHGIKQFARSTSDNLDWMGRNPLARGVGAVLGATSRFGEGLASDLFDQAAGHKPRTNAFKNVVTPQDDEKVTHRLERQVFSGPLNWWNTHTPEKFLGQPMHGHLPGANDGWRQAGLDFTTQTLFDPVTYAPGADAVTIAARLAKMAHLGQGAKAATGAAAKLIPQATKDSAAATLEHLKSNLSTSHDALKGLQQPGLNLVRAREGGARHLHQQRLDEYQPAIKALEPRIHSLDDSLRKLGLTGTDLHDPQKVALLPHADQQTLIEANKITDKALWREATPKVRRSMLARGYKPGKDEIGMPTTNLVSTDFGHNYIPEQTLYDKDAAKAAEAAKGFSYNRGGVKKSAADKTKSNAGSQDPLYDRFVNRLDGAAYLEPKRGSEQAIVKELGLLPSNAPRTFDKISELQNTLHIKKPGTPAHTQATKALGRYQALLGKQTQAAYNDAAKRANFLQPNAPSITMADKDNGRLFKGDVDMPQALHDRLYGDKARPTPGVAAKLGQGLAGVLFSNPAPHLLGNIAEQQTFAGGGPRALLGGAAEAVRLARKDPKAIDRLNQSKAVGAQYEKGYESGEPGKNIFSKGYNALQRGLTLGHEGQASELFQRYVKAGHTPEDAAEEVRKTFGRPYESSKEATKLKDAGSPFANWALSTVPRSTKKALGSVKGRNALKTYSRGVEDVNADVFEPEYGVEFNPGGFASRAASLALRPAAYFASQSLDNAVHDTAAGAKTDPKDVFKSAVPFAGPAMDLLGQPLSQKQRLRGGYKKIPWYLKIPTLAGGYYTHAETPHQKLMRELKRDGLR